MFYRLIPAVLFRSRNASELQNFRSLSYSFVSLSHHGCQVDQKSLEISREAPITVDVNNNDG